MDNREIKLIDLLSVAIKRLWILALAAILGAVVAIYYSKCIVVPQYRVSATFLVDMGTLSDQERELDQLEAQRQIVGSRYQVPSYVSILATSDFADAVSKRLAEMPETYPLEYSYSAGAIHSLVTFSYEEEMETYDMTVVAFSPDDALNIARCVEDFSEEYVSTHKVMAKNTLRIIDHARKSTSAINLNVTVNVMLGVVACVAIAFAICFLVEMNDVRIKSETGISEILGLPVIGSIPEYTTSDSTDYRGYYRRRDKNSENTSK